MFSGVFHAVAWTKTTVKTISVLIASGICIGIVKTKCFIPTQCSPAIFSTA